MFIGRTDAKAETRILWPRHVKSWLTEKDPFAVFVSSEVLVLCFCLCLSSGHLSQNEAWGHAWKLRAAKLHSGGLEANCVFDWRDSAWSECQYRQPLSPSNSISPKKHRLLLERKGMTNLDGIFESRDITLPTNVCLVKAMVFPVVMYECESWAIKKADCQRTDAFELWCWGRLLRVPWTARRSNQSTLKEISPEYSLEGLMLKLKLEYFGHLIGELTQLKRP